MKATVFSLLSLALVGLCTPAHAARLLVDFGRNDVATGGNQGLITPSPDVNGNYWNNFSREDFTQANDLNVPSGSAISDLVTTANVATTIDIRLTKSWEANGQANGGLAAPSAALLGDFAIATATRDYFFVETGGPANNPGTAVIEGLTPTSTYDFRFFGTRETTGTRTTHYELTGGNGVMSVNLQTSGAGIGNGGYNGNNDKIVSILGVKPNGSNAIDFSMSVVEGGFAYIGILEITEHPVPEPAAGALLALSSIGALVVRLRRRAA